MDRLGVEHCSTACESPESDVTTSRIPTKIIRNANALQQLEGKPIHYAQGKATGGSSIRNQMIYQRGSRGSYDRWAAEVGDDDFKWDNIKNFFDKTVNVTPYNNPFRAENASVAEYVVPQSAHESGPLQVSWPNFAMPFSS